MSDLTRKLFKGAAWLSAARLLINLVKAGSTLVIAWFISPDDYGIVAIAATVLVILSSVTDMQLGEALIGTKTADATLLHTVWTLGALRGLALSLGMAGLAVPLAHLYGDERLVAVLLVLSAQPFIAGLASPQMFLQQRQLNFRFEFVLTVTQKLSGAAVMIGLAVSLRSYWALIIGSVFEAALGVVISFLLIRYRPRPSLRAFSAIWGFSLWMTLSQLDTSGNHWLIDDHRDSLSVTGGGDHGQAIRVLERRRPAGGDFSGWRSARDPEQHGGFRTFPSDP